MLPLGLMQGRLTPSNGRGIQFFPHGPGEWEREFEIATTAGISFIQWVCDLESPLFSVAGQRAIRNAVSRTGVKVRNMDLHEMLTKTDIVVHSNEVFERICAGLAAIDGGTVELPMMEASSLLQKDAYDARVQALRRFVAAAQKHAVPVGIETDLDPVGLAALLTEIPELSVAYDSGNSAGMGYDVGEELAAYGKRISNVHIKDKPVGGTTVPLGEGSVDFPKLFSVLRAIPYTGAVTLQAARGEDGKEVETVRSYAQFIQEGWETARNQ